MNRIDPELLNRYAKGTCTDEERVLVEEWLDNEDNLFDQDAEPLSEPPSNQHQRASWDGFVEKIINRSPVFRWWKWGLGMSFLALLGLGIWNVFHAIHMNTSPAEMYTREVPRGKNMEIRLSDSSVIWLAGGSKLHYPQRFADTLRELHLVEGEMYLDVAQKNNQPFRIVTGGSIIEVLGTRFYVENRKNNPLIQVALEQGRVRFVYGTIAQQLHPGEQLSYRKADNRVEVHKVAPADIARWAKGMIQFHHTPLQEALEKLENHYDVRFLKDGNLNLDQPITGKFDNLPLSRVLHLLEGVTDLHFTQEGKTIKIN